MSSVQCGREAQSYLWVWATHILYEIFLLLLLSFFVRSQIVRFLHKKASSLSFCLLSLSQIGYGSKGRANVVGADSGVQSVHADLPVLSSPQRGSALIGVVVVIIVRRSLETVSASSAQWVV